MRAALEELEIPEGETSYYSVMISAPDKFHRGQYKAIIDMLIGNLNFQGFYIHQ